MRRGEDDLYMRTLEVAQVDSDDYFNHIVHKDLDRIVKDIQTAHTSDTTTADERQPTVSGDTEEVCTAYPDRNQRRRSLSSGILRPRWKSLMIR